MKVTFVSSAIYFCYRRDMSLRPQKLLPLCRHGPPHHCKSSHHQMSPHNPTTTWVSVALIPRPRSIFSNHICPLSHKGQEGWGQWAIARSSHGLSPPIMCFPAKPLLEWHGESSNDVLPRGHKMLFPHWVHRLQPWLLPARVAVHLASRLLEHCPWDLGKGLSLWN